MAVLVYFIFLAVAADLLPPLALAVNRTRNSARMKVALLGLVFFLFDLLGFLPQFRQKDGHNIWLAYILVPLQTLLISSILAEWQASGRTRRLLMILGWITTAIIVLLTLLVEDTNLNGLVTTVLCGVFLLSAALFTLFTRSLDEREELRRFDWFWVCIGLALYFVADVGHDPAIRALFALHHPDATTAIHMTKTAIQMLAMVFIARGLLCPVPPESMAS